MDSVADQARFTKAQDLNFPLLSDPDGSAVAKYRVRMEDRPLAALVDREVKVDSHGTDLAGLIRRLRGR